MRVTKMLSVNIGRGETITVPSNQYWKGTLMFATTSSAKSAKSIINGIRTEFEGGKAHSFAAVGDTTIQIGGYDSDVAIVIQGLIFEV